MAMEPKEENSVSAEWVPKKTGGNSQHRPGCRCNPCKGARRRQEEAQSEPARREPEGALSIFKNPLPYVDPNDPDTFVALPEFTFASKKRARIAKWLELKYTNPEMTNHECARIMGISPHYLQDIIRAATQEGWLKFSDPIERLENEIVPKVLDNLNHFLNLKDKTTTIETAKGTVFKTYQEAKGAGEGTKMVLALKIETASPDANLKPIEGQIVGTPKKLDG